MKPKRLRRNLLMSIVAGGGVAVTKSIPSTWTKPFVDVVVLPAHAQTSGRVTITPPEFQFIWDGPTHFLLDDVLNISWRIENTGDIMFEISDDLEISIDVPEGSDMSFLLSMHTGGIVHPGETISAVDIQGESQFDRPGVYTFSIRLFTVVDDHFFGPFFDTVNINVDV